VGPLARADETAMEASDTALEARMRARGYHHAQVTHDVVLANGLVTLRVRVDTGPLFRARFEGNEHYDAGALAGALALDEELDFAPSHLVQKIRDFYVKRGYLDVEVALEARGADTDATHALVFHIIEHDRVSVAARAYPCLKQDEIKKLKEGGPPSVEAIGSEIDSFLQEELPGTDLVVGPDPAGLDATITEPSNGGGVRPGPVELDPDSTYVAETYERAVAHVQELYRNEGYLHAQVGPIQVLRRQCSKRSPAGKCIPITLKAPPVDECAYDASNLPLPVPPLDPAYTCTPDPLHGIECEAKLTLRIPIKLGPRTTLWDMMFEGARAISEAKLARAADLPLGAPVNSLQIEDARKRVLDRYKEEGYAYADIKYTLDTSADHTRGRVRFDVTEGDQVIVRQIVVRGNEATNDWTIRRRIALEVGKPYRASDVQKTRERITTLNVFSNVSVDLEEPYVPQKSKVVIIRVTERRAQSIDSSIGVSTGEGVRGEIGYTHANLGGSAIALSLRVRLSYLPDPLILDKDVQANFDNLSPNDRLVKRVTSSLSFPEIGLGPLMRMQIDGAYVHALQRDFLLDKFAGVPGFQYRPLNELLFTLSQSFEHNDVHIFSFKTITDYINSVAASGASTTDLSRLLRVPDGPSHAFAQRFVVTWDRRDVPQNAHRGTHFVSALEHVDWYSEKVSQCPPACTDRGHTLRFSETLGVYIPVTKKITLASELRAGANVQLTSGSTTYPDRLFFLGGFDSLRGYALDNLVPQDYADRIVGTRNQAQPFTIADVALRGGNYMLNPRIELKVPLRAPLETALFMDSGNVWTEASTIFAHGFPPLRTAVGTGLRIATPIVVLAFDYGVNVSRLIDGPSSARWSYEDFGAFHFSMGLF
jgi:outer membrane protein assembly factor BamA